MNEIVINSINSKCYQPNIIIAIFLILYKSAEIIFYKKHLENSEAEFTDFIDKLINSVKVNKYFSYSGDKEYLHIISKKENDISITLYIDKNKYHDLNYEKISYIQQFSLYFKKYLSLLKTDDLHDEIRNMPSWETLSTNFINSIDKSCNPKDYKIFGVEHIQAIAYYMVNNVLKVKKIEIAPNPHNNSNFLEDVSWNIKITLSLKMFFKYFKYNNSKSLIIEQVEPIKYSIKERKIIELVHREMSEDGCKIPPEDILETLNTEWYENSKIYKNYKKYVSNFVSRLNKKYVHNTGHKLFESKDFKDCYYAPNYYEESEEF